MYVFRIPNIVTLARREVESGADPLASASVVLPDEVLAQAQKEPTDKGVLDVSYLTVSIIPTCFHHSSVCQPCS